MSDSKQSAGAPAKSEQESEKKYGSHPIGIYGIWLMSAEHEYGGGGVFPAPSMGDVKHLGMLPGDGKENADEVLKLVHGPGWAHVLKRAKRDKRHPFVYVMVGRGDRADVRRVE